MTNAPARSTKAHRWSPLLVALAVLIAASRAEAEAAPPARTTPATVMVTDDGALDPETIRTMRGLLATALRERHLIILEDKRFEEVALPGEPQQRALRELGADRIYALSVGRLGSKLLLTLQERSGETFAPAFSATLPANAVEEADRILPRLVDAVLARRPPGETARVGTVTSDEAREQRQKQAYKLVFLGLTFGFLGSEGRSFGRPFGINASIAYELQHVRVDLLGFIESHGSGSTGFLGLSGAYLFLDDDISPFVSAGLGYTGVGGAGTSTQEGSAGGLGVLAGAGVEFFRLHNFRVVISADLVVPLYSVSSLKLSSPVSPVLHVKFGF